MEHVESGPMSRFLSKPLSIRSICLSSLLGFVDDDVCIGLLLRTGECRLCRLDVGDGGDLEPMLYPADVSGEVHVAIVVFVIGNEYGENLLVDLDAKRFPRWEPDKDCVELNAGDKFEYNGCPDICNCPNADKL